MNRYDLLLNRAAAFYREHGVVDLTILAEAAGSGFDLTTFQADVARRADEPTDD